MTEAIWFLWQLHLSIVATDIECDGHVLPIAVAPKPAVIASEGGGQHAFVDLA